MTTREKLTIFLPLAGYLVYVLFLVFLSSRPFLLRWIEGCFGLFAALVLCNLIKRRMTAGPEEEKEETGD